VSSMGSAVNTRPRPDGSGKEVYIQEIQSHIAI